MTEITPPGREETTPRESQAIFVRPRQHAPPRFSPRRIWAMVLRYSYLLRGSWPRLLEMAYWPTIQIVMWGFISQFFMSHSDWLAQAAGVLLGAVLLWDVMFRSQLGLSLSFMEEMWSRNLGQLMATPLRPYELVAALATMSLIRTLIGVTPAAFLAIPLFGFSIFDMGIVLAAFFANLMIMGWAIGLVVSALVLRFGLGAESLAWLVIFALAPLSAIFYPVSILPDWLHPVAHAIPASHVFEGMRALLIDGAMRFDYLVNAVVLNIAYIAGGTLFFLYMMHVARRRGLLLNIGE